MAHSASDPPERPRSPRPPSILRSPRSWIFLLAIAIAYAIAFGAIQSRSSNGQVHLSYSAFQSQVAAGNVTSVTSSGNTISGDSRRSVADSSDPHNTSTSFTTQVPGFAGQDLESLLERHHVRVDATTPDSESAPYSLLLAFGPILLVVAGVLWFARRMGAMGGGGGAGGLFGFGQSKARLYDAERPSTTFADVAGVDEAQQELEEVVDFLREPARYQRLGGMIPRGVLLVGPPGTGKTLLARAVAGEARVPFFSATASEFIEMIVGVGAARTRDLFKKARSAAPAMVFIDEIDAIGRSRGRSVNVGGHNEQEQTLNQILAEMDGFDSREGVIVIAATNRADVLDPALLRPGRFDRQIVVQPPDRPGRAAILGIHLQRVPLDLDVDVDVLASETPGLVGAELRNLVNEAALLAARRDRERVTRRDFLDALTKVLLGVERHIAVSKADRERIAYHESGHALLGLLVPGGDPVRSVSIVPRGRSLGATLQSPVDDRLNYAESYLRARIVGALGGRAAEEVVYGEISTGAESDLHVLTRIAYQMVARWGMSRKLGPLDYGEPREVGVLSIGGAHSQDTAQLIDLEVRRIVEESYDTARLLLRGHRPELDALARALLERETLGEQEVLEVVGASRVAMGTPPDRLPAPAVVKEVCRDGSGH